MEQSDPNLHSFQQLCVQIFNMNGYIFRGGTTSIFIFAVLLSKGQLKEQILSI